MKSEVMPIENERECVTPDVFSRKLEVIMLALFKKKKSWFASPHLEWFNNTRIRTLYIVIRCSGLSLP